MFFCENFDMVDVIECVIWQNVGLIVEDMIIGLDVEDEDVFEMDVVGNVKVGLQV